ncbi:hypothetical protein P43SY_001806 [Pythium insidiosum]|uniref:Uncharacterized protein n=1 Tax=Pythium insidiosum TaxID=114742 RepID=A0AAD5QCU4_PYTIN|nr:hypothetical protein P43SY_001806 [Pythium insidiosum]
MIMDDVLEVGDDGAFDVSARSTAAFLREKGNEAFQRQAYELALSFYSQALGQDGANHMLFSNRSAALCQLKRYADALVDADRAIQLAPQWPKAYTRRAAACVGLGRVKEAIEALEKAVKLDPAHKDAQLLKTRIEKLRRQHPPDNKKKTRQSTPSSTVIQRGFFETSKAKASSGIYAEKEEIVRPVVDPATGDTRLEHDDERRWRYMLRRLKTGCNKTGVNASGESVVLDDGVFAKLLSEKEFQSLIYPGLPSEQLRHAPRNLQELLEDPWYEAELLALMPKVQQKAESVLTNVKKRGAAMGETMDAATEQRLLPQVLQEAFAREVLAMVHRVNYRKHALLATDARTIADPSTEQATWDQLPQSFLLDLFSQAPRQHDAVAGTAVLDGFMGDEWTSVLLGDVERMTGGRGSAVSCGRMRFVERSDCEKEFPALAELLERLHALPYEINAKASDRATLCAQFAHCTALQQLTRGDAQRLRLDCGQGERDNGFKLTCVYFLNGVGTAGSSGGDLQLRTDLEETGRVQRVVPQSDRLVMFQSQRVLNEITALHDTDQALYYVTFWIHGRELRSC